MPVRFQRVCVRRMTFLSLQLLLSCTNSSALKCHNTNGLECNNTTLWWATRISSSINPGLCHSTLQARHWNGSAAATAWQASVVSIVEEFKNHPALLAWYICDDCGVVNANLAEVALQVRHRSCPHWSMDSAIAGSCPHCTMDSANQMLTLLRPDRSH
jgi:hypothetical protein